MENYLCVFQARELMQAEMISEPEQMAANEFGELCDSLDQQLTFVPASQGSCRFARTGILSKKERCEALEHQLEVLYCIVLVFIN